MCCVSTSFDVCLWSFFLNLLPPLLAQMCPSPSCQGFEIESETSEDADVQHNIWNKMLEIFTYREAVFCYKMFCKIGRYAGSHYPATLLWTSSTLSQLEEYEVTYAIHQRNLAVSKGCQFEEGMYRTKSEGGNAGMHQNVIEHSTLMKPGKAYETVEGGYMG